MFAWFDSKPVQPLFAILATMVVLLTTFTFPAPAVAAVPVTEVTIELEKTGSEPFNTGDQTDDCLGGNTFDSGRTFSDGSVVIDGDNGPGFAGQDTCSDNDVVRIGDSNTYKVEVSNNDSDVDFLTATVTLDPYDQATQLPSATGTIHQEWIEIPSGCEIDPLIVTPISALQDLDGDGYNETLFCNLGFAREGTNKVFFPAAKVIGASTDGTKATLNDSIVGASVTATGISNSAATGNNGTSAPASDGPAESLVTGDFRVNLTKEMVGFSYDADGNPIWPKLDAKPGPAGEAGYLALYDFIAVYQPGSMIADSPDELIDTDGDGFLYDADYDLLDIFTDDNTNNDSPLSSGALLYDWDPSVNACAFNGNNGPGATVTCTQPNYPFDWTGPSFVPDGVADPNMQIDLDNIDVRDPNGDGTLFNIRIGIWIPKADVDNHPTCSGGSCQFFHINEAQALDTSTNTPGEFSPQSTEDASGNNLDNYGTGSEPGGIGSPDQNTANSDNVTKGLLQVSSPGPWSYRKTFQRTSDNTTYYPKIADQLRAKNEVLPVLLNIYDYRLIDGGKSQVCDKIDTTQYEFVGVPTWDKWPKYADPGGVIDWAYYDIPSSSAYAQSPQNNPSAVIWGGTGNERIVHIDAASQTTTLYSDSPNGSGSLADLDNATCEDDVNGDGVVNITDAAGVESSPGNPVDWYEDYTMVPAAADGTSGVTKFRFESTYDHQLVTDEYNAWNNGHKNIQYSQIYDLKVRPDATGYGTKKYMPNYADARRTSTGDNNTWLAWQDNATDSVQDPGNVSFSYNLYSADRNILVDSGISVGKKTVPEGIKVVRGGDIIQFEIQPTVFGLWTGSETGDVIDNLPPGTDYIAGSEEFSVDGGATWMDHAAYLASSPDVVLTSSPTPGGQDPITWSFSSIDAGEQMPLIRYSVQVDSTLTSGNFTNTVTFRARGIAADNRFVTDSDGDGVNDTGDGVGDDVKASYKLTILPKFGFDVLKQTSQEVFNVDEAFTFDLIYKNLGGAPYSGGEFIDILPFNGDSSTTIGGQQSQRTPASNFSGYYDVEEISFGNGETFEVTDVNPSTLNLDPCAASNLPAGYVPSDPAVSGAFYDSLCYQDYVNNGNVLPDGGATGTASAGWQACAASGSPLVVASSCPIAPEDITAIRFRAPTVPTTGGQTVSITLDPSGNLGGEPVYTTDANGVQIVDWANSPAIGDVFTNTFGGRIPEISLNVISNDQSVTSVWGTVGDLVWWDYGDDGTVNGSDGPIAGQTLQIFDSAGQPLYVDPATGAVINAADKATYEAVTGTTLTVYTTVTNGFGNYEFINLPQGSYRIDVINPLSIQTYDLDDGLAANNDSSVFTLAQETDALTGNITGVEDRLDVDFGYRLSVFDVELDKTLLTTGPYILGQEVEFQIDVENLGPDAAPDVEITDAPYGLTYVAGSASPTTGTFTNPVWDVGQLAAGQSESITLKYTITAATLTDPIGNFAEVSDDGAGDYGSDVDSNPGDNTSGTDADDPESDDDLETGTDTHDDEAGIPLTVVADPSIKITKTAGDASDGEIFVNDPEGTVTFTYLVENDGGTDLANATITDDAGTPGDTSDDVTVTSAECPGLALLEPGDVVTCTLELDVTTENSPYQNNAGTTGTPVNDDGDPYPGIENPSDDDIADVVVPPGIEITKTAGGAADGDPLPINEDGTVTFTFVVENTGGTYLTDMTIVDDAGTPGDTSDDVTLTSAECPGLAGPLAPGDTVPCTADFAVDTTPDGSYQNNAGTTGSPTDENGDPLVGEGDPILDEDGNPVLDEFGQPTFEPGEPLFEDPTDDDDAIVLTPGIKIVKTAGDAADGEIYVNDPEGTVTFTFDVINTGGTYLTGMTITDDAGTPGDTSDDVTLTSAECAGLAGPLAPGATVTCTLDLDVTTANSPYTNTAGATGSPTDENGDSYVSQGDPILDEDGNPVLDEDGNPTYEDGEPFDLEDPTDDDPSDVVVPPSIKLTKTAGTAADGTPFVINGPGLVPFTFVVENDGGTYLTDVMIIDDAGTPDDPLDDVIITASECAGLAGPIAPGDSVACVVEIMVTDTDHVNSAGATGSPTDENGDPYVSQGDPILDEDGNPVLDEDGNPTYGPGEPLFEDPTDDDDAETLYPGISIVKTAGDAADGAIYVNPESGMVPFTFVVTNTGGTHLTNATIIDDAGTPGDTSDDVLVDSTTCAGLAGPIAPGDSVTCEIELLVDLENSPYTNTAGTSGSPTDENGDPYVSQGDPILDEDGNPVLDEDGNPTYEPGEPYDLEDPTDEDPSDVVLPPGIDLVKTAGTAADGDDYTISEPGMVPFTFVVTNTGGTYLTGVAIVDDAGTSDDTTDDVVISSAECAGLAGPIAPGDSVTCVVEIMVTDTDHVNSAGATGSPTDENGEEYTTQGDPILDEDGNPALDEDGNPTYGPGEPLFEDPYDGDIAKTLIPGIDIVKTAGDAPDGELYIGKEGLIPFTYVVTNTGGTYLTDIVIVDDAGTPSDPSDDVTTDSTTCAELAGPLAPGETVTCVTELSVSTLSGVYINNAGVTGTPADETGAPIPGVLPPQDADDAQVENDSDGDGLPDSQEKNIDTDGDGIPDYLDVDSDGDGIPDAQEAKDANGDGILDHLQIAFTGSSAIMLAAIALLLVALGALAIRKTKSYT